MNSPWYIYLPVAAGIIGGLIGGYHYKKNKLDYKKNKLDNKNQSGKG